ncbi:alpha/beta fold hydrolase [Georgenia alba]|uniref:Alpha/beta fold hydrolase n=1 Tax=Georgenia alba TaxID=2233858 RepID=A0ABW2Q390_9MICO
MLDAPRLTVWRSTVEVDGHPASYLTAGRSGAPPVLMLHGTYWSRVWLPVLDHLAGAGLRPIAVDLPGSGRSGGELVADAATVPALADWATRFVSALGLSGPIALAGHDIGGAIAQHLLAHDRLHVPRFALVNSVLYDSWPAPHVAQFRDGGADEAVLIGRRQALERVLAGVATESLIAEYAEPWTDERVRRSWMALAGAADSRYTLELVPALQRSVTPKLLIWGEDDLHEKVEYAERFAAEVPNTALLRISHADHIPTENNPDEVGRALAAFFAGPPRSPSPDL